MKLAQGRFKFNKWIVLSMLGISVFILIIAFIVRALMFSYQCNEIYYQVSTHAGNNDLVMYGEYDNQIVEIAYENRFPIWDTVSDKMVEFTSADKTPDDKPVTLRFEDGFSMEVYPTDSKDLFVKHVIKDKIKYYYIKNTNYFDYLVKMVSPDGWSAANLSVSN
ncbi:MAG: hypothetical protein QM644_09620 [Mobilitalea sp.]